MRSGSCSPTPARGSSGSMSAGVGWRTCRRGLRGRDVLPAVAGVDRGPSGREEHPAARRHHARGGTSRATWPAGLPACGHDDDDPDRAAAPGTAPGAAGPAPEELRVEALQALLVARGLITADEVRRTIEAVDAGGEALGARIVARAWVAAAFRARLLTDAGSAVAELGIDRGLRALVALENTERLHQWSAGLLVLPAGDSWVGRPAGTRASRTAPGSSPTADMRYLVVPTRPRGTEGWSEAALATLVTRDSMIGVARAREPR